MHTPAEKTPENSSHAAAGHASKNQSAVVTNSEAYGVMANNSPRVKQLKFYQALADSVSLKTAPLPENAQQHSFSEVIQRSPADWQGNGDLTRILTHPHGYFSTWKDIKAKINAYKLLQPNVLTQRKALVLEIFDLIDEWERKHPLTDTEQRVVDIRNDIPLLRQIVNAEFVEVRDAIENKVFTDFRDHGTLPPDEIPHVLTVGVTGTAAQKAQRLFQNINRFRFKYTGAGLNARVGFASHQGDCGTLVLMYEAVAESVNLPTARGTVNTRLLVAPQAIHGRTTLGNTENNTDWFFHNHHWIIAGGGTYDLLYMGAPPAYTAYTGARQHNGVTYHLFADGRVVIEPSQQAHLTHQIGGTGRVFADEQTAQTFIDTNHT